MSLELCLNSDSGANVRLRGSTSPKLPHSLPFSLHWAWISPTSCIEFQLVRFAIPDASLVYSVRIFLRAEKQPIFTKPGELLLSSIHKEVKDCLVSRVEIRHGRVKMSLTISPSQRSCSDPSTILRQQPRLTQFRCSFTRGESNRNYP